MGTNKITEWHWKYIKKIGDTENTPKKNNSIGGTENISKKGVRTVGCCCGCCSVVANDCAAGITPIALTAVCPPTATPIDDAEADDDGAETVRLSRRHFRHWNRDAKFSSPQLQSQSPGLLSTCACIIFFGLALFASLASLLHSHSHTLRLPHVPVAPSAFAGKNLRPVTELARCIQNSQLFFKRWDSDLFPQCGQ